LTTEAELPGDERGKVLTAAIAPQFAARSESDARASGEGARVTFAEVYEQEFEFVFRTVRRLGVAENAAEDVAQEVFVIVHKSLAGFEHRSSVRTWLFGIARNVAYRHRRALGRRISVAPGQEWAVDVAEDETARSAQELAERSEAARVLDALLESMDDEKREVFVLVELEEMSMPEVADAIGINLNTAYTRLRAARKQFEEVLVRYRARAAARGSARIGLGGQGRQ
jgi:RNA polymerase sigma-70 factor (ECF subfamily)